MLCPDAFRRCEAIEGEKSVRQGLSSGIEESRFTDAGGCGMPGR